MITVFPLVTAATGCQNSGHDTMCGCQGWVDHKWRATNRKKQKLVQKMRKSRSEPEVHYLTIRGSTPRPCNAVRLYQLSYIIVYYYILLTERFQDA